MVAMCVLDASICRLAFLRTRLQSRSFRSLKCRLIYSVPLALQISSVHNFLHKTQNLTCPRLLLKSLFVFFLLHVLTSRVLLADRNASSSVHPACVFLFSAHTHAHVAIYFIGNNEAAPEQQQQRQDRSGDEDDNREKDLEPMLYRTRYLTALKFTGRLYGWTQCLLRGVWLKPSPRNPASLVAMETQSRAVNCW